MVFVSRLPKYVIKWYAYFTTLCNPLVITFVTPSPLAAPVCIGSRIEQMEPYLSDGSRGDLGDASSPPAVLILGFRNLFVFAFASKKNFVEKIGLRRSWISKKGTSILTSHSFHQKVLDPLLMYLVHAITGWSNKPFSKKNFPP